MNTLITSCGRLDLLRDTIHSLVMIGQQEPLQVTVHEDSDELFVLPPFVKNVRTGKVGQHKSIEMYLHAHSHLKHYLHLEDDWHVDNSYNWIQRSLDIMELNPMIIKVLARKGSPHPCKHDRPIYEFVPRQAYFGYVEPWRGADNILWSGFSWNPGVTRLDLLKEFMPFPKWEQDLAENIYKAGYKVVELKDGVFTHTGDGQSTH